MRRDICLIGGGSAGKDTKLSGYSKEKIFISDSNQSPDGVSFIVWEMRSSPGGDASREAVPRIISILHSTPDCQKAKT